MTDNQHTDTVHRIIEWFRAAKPTPTIKNALTQLGCHLEEMEEMLGGMDNADSYLAQELRQASNELKSIDVEQYAAEVHTMMSEWDKVELLDSLCDQIVTAIGTAYDLGFDIVKFKQGNYTSFQDNEKDSMLEIGKYYNLKTIDVEALSNINLSNWTTYCNYTDVHPKSDGYERWADTIIRELGV